MKELALIIWMLLTCFLALSVIGLVLFIPIDTWQNAESTPSSWMQIGRKLLNKIIE
jgi:hypothetical protein